MKLFLCALLLATASSALAQQDPLYNLYFYNQAMINPAYAGLYKETNLNLITRKQWIGIKGSPLTNFISVTSSFGRRVGVGIMAVDDRLGINVVQEAQAAFSYKIIEREGTVLSLGIQGGLLGYRYDYSNLNLEYLDDEDLTMNLTRFRRPNVGTGIFFRNERFYAGISVPRMLSVDVNDGMTTSTRYLAHYYFSAGMLIIDPVHRLFNLKPSVLFRMMPGGNKALDLNIHAMFLETLWVGVTLRNLNALGVNAQLQIAQRVRAAYSFELPTSSLIARNFGTHELSLMLALSPFASQQKVIRYY